MPLPEPQSANLNLKVGYKSNYIEESGNIVYELEQEFYITRDKLRGIIDKLHDRRNK